MPAHSPQPMDAHYKAELERVVMGRASCAECGRAFALGDVRDSFSVADPDTGRLHSAIAVHKGCAPAAERRLRRLLGGEVIHAGSVG